MQRAGGAEAGGGGGERGRRVGVGFGGRGNDFGRWFGWLLLWLGLLGGVAAFVPAEAGHVEVCADEARVFPAVVGLGAGFGEVELGEGWVF